MAEFSQRLKSCRERMKNSNPIWTQGYVADKIGVARSTYTAYENGTKQPPIGTINALADLFNVSSDYLFGRTEIINVNNSDNETDKSFFISKIASEFPDIELMFKDMESLSAEDMKEVYDYIKFKKSQKKGDDK